MITIVPFEFKAQIAPGEYSCNKCTVNGLFKISPISHLHKICSLMFHRAGRDGAQSLFGHQEMVVGVVITVHVTAIPTVSTRYPSAALQRAAASPGIWKSVPQPSPPPTVVEKITTAKS